METQELQMIGEIFSEFIRGMRDDIDGALNAGASMLAALGLVCYTEVLGGFRTGKLGVAGQVGANFTAFQTYMAEANHELRTTLDLYTWVRCGLVHEYFPKSKAGVVQRPDDPRVLVVDRLFGRRLFNVSAYARYFFQAAWRYRDEMLQHPDSPLMQNFLNCADRLLGDESDWSDMPAEFDWG